MKYEDLVGTKYEELVGTKYEELVGTKYEELVGTKYEELVGTKYVELVGTKYEELVGTKTIACCIGDNVLTLFSKYTKEIFLVLRERSTLRIISKMVHTQEKRECRLVFSCFVI
jgi:hypothetical protein